MEAGFQGALDNYAYGNENGRGTDPQEHLAALAGFGSSTFQGVEPMGVSLGVVSTTAVVVVFCAAMLVQVSMPTSMACSRT